MAIISGTKATKKEKLKATVSSSVVQQMNDYCQWAGIDDIGFFIEESACFVFEKDKEWKDHQRAIRRAKKSTDSNS